MNEQWIENSFRLRRFEGFANYYVRVFKGLTMYVHLPEEENVCEGELARKIKGQEGRVLNKLMVQKTDIIVVSSNEYEKHWEEIQRQLREGGLDARRINIPIVTDQWLEECINMRLCVDTARFDLRKLLGIKDSEGIYNYWGNKVKVPRIHNLEHKIAILSELSADSPEGLFLYDCVVYCVDLEAAEVQSQHNMAILGGGFYVRSYNTTVTHIIVNSIKGNCKYKENIHDYRRGPYIVNENWLKECIIMSKHMGEWNYKPGIVGYKPSGQEIGCRKYRIKSVILKGIKFEMNTDSYREEKEEYIRRRVEENGGEIVAEGTSTPNTRPRYKIENDGVEKSKWGGYSFEESGEQIVVSHRWIEWAISNKRVPSVAKSKLLHLCPFPYPIPYPGFRGCRLLCLGLNKLENYVITHLFIALGGEPSSTTNSPTHLICQGTNYHTHHIPANIHIIKPEWIFDSIENGIKMTETNYLLPQTHLQSNALQPLHINPVKET